MEFSKWKFGAWIDPFKQINENIKFYEDGGLGDYNIYQTPQGIAPSEREIRNGWGGKGGTFYGTSREYNFYGYDENDPRSLKEQMSFDALSRFLDQGLLQRAKILIEQIKGSIDLGGNLEADKLKTTSIPMGVFDFGLASKGLMRDVEFYEPKSDMLIEGSRVNMQTLKGESVFVYTDKNTGEERVLRRQQKGTYQIKKKCLGIEVRFERESGMYLPYRQNKRGDFEIFFGCEQDDINDPDAARLQFTTTTKKVYMYRENLGGVSPYVDVMFATGGNYNINTPQMFIKALPALLLTEVLEEAGVSVRCWATTSAAHPSRNPKRYTFQVFKIKDYGEPMDINVLSSFVGDPRFFRNWLWKNGAIWTRRRHNFMYGNPASIYPYDGNTKGLSMIAMPYFRNWLMSQKKEGKISFNIPRKELMVWPVMRGFQTNLTIDSEGVEEQVLESFYASADYMSLVLSKNPRKVIGKIREREIELKGIDGAKKYIQDSLVQTIADYYVAIPPSDNIPEAYRDTAEEYKEALERKERIFELIGEAFDVDGAEWNNIGKIRE